MTVLDLPRRTIAPAAKTLPKTLSGTLNRLEIPAKKAWELYGYQERQRERAERKRIVRDVTLGLLALAAVNAPVAVLFPVGCALTGPLSFAAALLATATYEAYARWAEYPLDYYEGAVPAFASQIVTAIKDDLPEARFTVSELRVNSGLDDPILYVSYGGTVYAVAIWDRKGRQVSL
jgi:hypothetical protein